MKSPTYFIYARKSTDDEERQQLSIPAQLDELKSFAQKEGLTIIDTLIESKTAKVPGRELFNGMIERINNGESQGILAWHPDRLARNAVDAGQIVHLLDTNKLVDLKFPTFWFQNTPQGLFMLSIAFGQSKYYVDALSVNTKRGLRQKVRLGWMPAQAPRGYLNERLSKTIVKDPKEWKQIKLLFEYYSQGTHTFSDASDFLSKNNFKSSYGNNLKIDAVKSILKNPFYCGLFWYSKELHPGKHEPIISKKLYDTVQEVLTLRSRPQTKVKIPKPFTGLIRCGECGMMITSEVQKGYLYYRCTKKSKTHDCQQPFIREEKLLEQINSHINQVSLRTDWADKMLAKLNKEKDDISQSVMVASKELKGELSGISKKINFLLDSFLDQTISREDYLLKKSQLISKKKTLEEKLLALSRRPYDWLERMRDWIVSALRADKIASDNKNLFQKREFLIKCGSNLTLKDKTVDCDLPDHWAALRAAQQVGTWVPRVRVELTSGVFQTSAVTTLATSAMCAGMGSNHRPHVYKTCALTTELPALNIHELYQIKWTYRELNPACRQAGRIFKFLKWTRGESNP